MSSKSLRFMISGGGSGGHIYPAIAIADQIKANQANAEFLFVGAKGKMEMEKVPDTLVFTLYHLHRTNWDSMACSLIRTIQGMAWMSIITNRRWSFTTMATL